MLKTRINRVINNHQLSCSHTGNYLYLLKGFEDILPQLSLSVEALDYNNITPNTNYYVTYEEAYNHLNELETVINQHPLSVWTVDFNLIPNYYISDKVTEAYSKVVAYDDLYLVTYKEIKGLNPNHNITIFNTINSLIGISEDESRRDSVYQYVEVYKEITHI